MSGQPRARPALYLQSHSESVPATQQSGRAGPVMAGQVGAREQPGLSSLVSPLVPGPAPHPARELRCNNSEKRNVRNITTLIMATLCRSYQPHRPARCLYRGTQFNLRSPLTPLSPTARVSARARAVIHLQPNAGTESWLHSESNK